MLNVWDMKSEKALFSSSPPRELTHLELPKGTVLELEIVSEMKGEVSAGVKKFQKLRIKFL